VIDSLVLPIAGAAAVITIVLAALYRWPQLQGVRQAARSTRS
jgi:hypothetical protein